MPKQFRQKVCVGCPHRTQGYLNGNGPHIGCLLGNLPQWVHTPIAARCTLSNPKHLAKLQDNFPNLLALASETPPHPSG